MLNSRQLVQLTLLFISLCCASIYFVDQPHAYIVHDQAGSLQPLFRELTAFTDLVTGYTLWRYFSAALVMAVGLVVLALDKHVRRAKYFFFVSLTEVSSRVVVGLLKDLVERERPAHFLETGHPVQTFWITGGDSFPSGHVGRYFGIFLPLMVLVPRYRLPLLIVPLYIFLGRLILTVHYLSDALASIYIAIIITTLYAYLLKIGRRDEQPVTSIHETVR